MAWAFTLCAECGTQKESAEAFLRHFKDFIVILSDGTRHKCLYPRVYEDGGWWACLYPDGVSTSGIQTPDDERQMAEISFAFYDRLKTAPQYRYAFAGVEVESFRCYDELDEDIVNLDFSGLVLADDVWKRLGSPSIFVPFALGYRWRPFVRAK